MCYKWEQFVKKVNHMKVLEICRSWLGTGRSLLKSQEFILDFWNYFKMTMDLLSEAISFQLLVLTQTTELKSKSP